MLGILAILREHALAARFRELGAVEADRALTLTELKAQRDGAFEALLKAEAIVEAEDGRFHLNEARAKTLLTARRVRSLVILCILVVLWSAYMVITPLVYRP